MSVFALTLLTAISGSNLGAKLSIGLAVLLLILLFSYGSPFRMVFVPTNSVCVMEKFGRYSRLLPAGVHVLYSFEKPRSVTWTYHTENPQRTTSLKKRKLHSISLAEQMYDFPAFNMLTKDGVNVKVDPVMYFKISNVSKAVYNVVDLTASMEQIVETSLRAILSRMSFAEAEGGGFEKHISSDVVRNLSQIMRQWGVTITRLQIQQFMPPRDILEMRHNRLLAAQERDIAIKKAQNELECARLAAERLTLEKKAEADAKAVAINITAVADAKRQEVISKAQAGAVARLAESFGGEMKVDPEMVLKFMNQDRYIAALPTMIGDQSKDRKLVVLPYDASQMTSSLMSTQLAMGLGGGGRSNSWERVGR
mmetsp:Transcript_25887/g.43325  ORF Transcript_25887/g.43325 Transcript_25887/m.43325 type:complete len:367 (+) Transcript_25887:264-1364(+)|eukprot:jgi/Bigna1/53970/estExt_Genewise1Plus.C_270012